MMNHTTYRPFGVLAISMGLCVGCAGTSDEFYDDPQPIAEVPPPPAPVIPAEPQGPTAQEAQASIEAARQAIQGAQRVGVNTSDAARILTQAEIAAARGNASRAVELADQVQSQLAIARPAPRPAAPVRQVVADSAYSERARSELKVTNEFSNLSADQFARQREAEVALREGRARNAYDTLRALNAELSASSFNYKVLRGDSLWRISAKKDIYGNPYQWPLIYKNNTDRLKDPDRIFPGQDLGIVSHPTIDEVTSAVKHAQKRGKWALNKRERLDIAYLKSEKQRTSVRQTILARGDEVPVWDEPQRVAVAQPIAPRPAPVVKRRPVAPVVAKQRPVEPVKPAWAKPVEAEPLFVEESAKMQRKPQPVAARPAPQQEEPVLATPAANQPAPEQQANAEQGEGYDNSFDGFRFVEEGFYPPLERGSESSASY